MITNEYAAGFFDGEGSIMIRYDRRCDSYILKLSVSNTVRSVLEAYKEKWGGSICDYLPKKINHSGWSDWSLQGKSSVPFLKEIYPFLVVKKQQADLAFELIATYQLNPGRGRRLPSDVKELRKALKEKLHAMKTKGHGLRGAS